MYSKLPRLLSSLNSLELDEDQECIKLRSSALSMCWGGGCPRLLASFCPETDIAAGLNSQPGGKALNLVDT